MFGTIVTLPVVLYVDSFHGPSTTDHSLLDAYVAACLDWAVRNV